MSSDQHAPDPQPGRAADDPVGSWDGSDIGDASDLAAHLKNNLGSFTAGGLAAFGRHLLDAFKHHSAPEPGAESGVKFDDVLAGSPGAISTLVDLAKNNPDVLNTATSRYVSDSNSADHMSPELMSELVARMQKG